MDAQFWINKWEEGQIGFHKDHYHESLVKHFPSLKAQPGQKVLVPLCGKTKDLLWLHQEGLMVHGVELSVKASEAFFKENHFLDVTRKKGEHFIEFFIPGLTISTGDIFKFPLSEEFDFIYDRASLVALPAAMRKKYAELMKKALVQGGKYLLIVYEYAQEEMAGPPFSVDESEVHELYERDFKIKLIEEVIPEEGARLMGLTGFKQKTYLLERI